MAKLSMKAAPMMKGSSNRLMPQAKQSTTSIGTAGDAYAAKFKQGGGGAFGSSF